MTWIEICFAICGFTVMLSVAFLLFSIGYRMFKD